MQPHLEVSTPKLATAAASRPLAKAGNPLLAKPDTPQGPPDELRAHSIRTATKHEFATSQRVAMAVAQLDQLPDAGVTLHGMMTGSFNGWDMVPAILEMIAPATISRLYVATLGFNRRNAAQLLQLMDAGQIGHCSFICSVFYEAGERPVCDALRRELAARGSRMLTTLCHAKILAIETTAGSFYVNESSANLRSCSSLEQFALTNSRELWQFHAAWMDSLFDGKKETR